MKHPVRILQVVTIMNLGGLENFLMNLYRKIDREQIQFDFLVHRKEKGVFDDEIKSLGGKIYDMPALHPLKIISYQRKLSQFFKNHPEYKIVHSHLNEGSVFVLYAAKKCGVPVRIAHSHTDTTTGRFGLLREIPKLRVNNYSNYNFACTENAGKWLFRKSEFKIIVNGIDTKRFGFNRNIRNDIRSKLNLNDNNYLVGNISNFTQPKNLTFLISIFWEFLKIKPKSKLVLIGHGGLKDRIIRQVKEYDIEDHVIFAGAVTNPEDYLSAMDLFLFPSLFEGLPLTLVEAQCNGLPVLMSDTISKECILTELVFTMSLDKSTKDWAEELTNLSRLERELNQREIYAEQIKEKGFDVEDNVIELSDFYLEQSALLAKK